MQIYEFDRIKTAYRQNMNSIFFPTAHQKVHSSLLSALLCRAYDVKKMITCNVVGMQSLSHV